MTAPPTPPPGPPSEPSDAAMTAAMDAHECTESDMSIDYGRVRNEVMRCARALDAFAQQAVLAEREAIIREITGKTIGDGPVRMVVGSRRVGKTFGLAIDAVVSAIRARGGQGKG